MCKHVAAALYGVGARLDEAPRLLFVLRDVDEKELLAGAGQGLALPRSAPTSAKLLDDSDVAALFGLDMAESTDSRISVPASAKPIRPPKTMKGRKASKTPVPKVERPRRTSVSARPKSARLAAAGKGRA
jgi:uncharacterized Zn finger protein